MATTRALKDAVYWCAKRAASSYIAGVRLEEALSVCYKLKQRGWSTTICQWNQSGDSADAVCQSYLLALDTLSKEALDGYLSIKVPALSYKEEKIGQLISVAKRNSIRVHFDSHGPETVEPTFALINKFSTETNNLGCTLPSCWSRSLKDADWAAHKGIAIRIVKGQWTDESSAKIDPCVQYEKIVQRLCGKRSLVAVATHDLALAKRCLRMLKESDTPTELEQLYGLPLSTAKLAESFGVPVRVYVPYGYGYLPYALSKMLKNPKMLWWLSRDFAKGLYTQRN